jgi:hypothetical protein
VLVINLSFYTSTEKAPMLMTKLCHISFSFRIRNICGPFGMTVAYTGTLKRPTRLRGVDTDELISIFRDRTG